MDPTLPRALQIIGAEWRDRCRELADWAMERLVNRLDVWGQYTKPSARELREGGSFNLRWARLPLAMLLGQPGGDDWNGLRYGLDYPTLFAAIRAELAPWLLGLGDPLRARASTRSEVEVPPQDREH